jgi:hypothetical protein
MDVGVTTVHRSERFLPSRQAKKMWLFTMGDKFCGKCLVMLFSAEFVPYGSLLTTQSNMTHVTKCLPYQKHVPNPSVRLALDEGLSVMEMESCDHLQRAENLLSPAERVPVRYHLFVVE